MKKFLILIFICLAFSIANAQDKTMTFSNTKTYHSFVMAAADTVTNNDQLYYFEITANEHWPMTQDWLLSLHKVSGAPRIAVLLQGKKFTTSAYTNIGSAVTWYGTTNDTTIVISNATANRYRFYKLGLDATATAQKSTITKSEFKVWLE
jgi:hypothetical protein